MRKALTLNPRSACALLLGGALAAWLALPLPRRETVQAVVVPRASQVLYAPRAARVRAILVKRGERVKNGQELLRLEDRNLETDLRLLTLEREVIVRELANIAADEQAHALTAQKRERLAQVEARLQGVRDRLQDLIIRAQMSGFVCELDPDLRAGAYVSQGAVLGRIADTGRVKVVGYLAEEQMARVNPAGAVWFIDGADGARCKVSITYRSPVQAARIDYPALTSLARGDIAVTRAPNNALLPHGSWYRVEAALERDAGGRRLGHTGFIRFTTHPRSRLADALGYLWGVLLRESGF